MSTSRSAVSPLHAQGPTRLGAVVCLTLLAIALGSPLEAQQPPLFVQTIGFATKTGFRGVFSWRARQPVAGVVHYGTDPAALDQTAMPIPGGVDTAQIAVAQLVTGNTYYFQIEDTLTGERSAVGSFEAVNSYNDWNGSIYTLDLLVQLDSQSLPPEIPADQALADIAAGVNVFAERVYDALDGFARVGTVLITDTNLDYAGNVPFQSLPACAVPQANLADVLVQTTVPFDSHTFGGWAIDNACTSFYVGRIGQLVVPWENDLHFGYVSTHEMMHYAFNAPDLYDLGTVEETVPADCRNLAWDGSLMHNTGGFVGKWELTELDRNPTLTPCDHGDQPYSWDALRQRYTRVPERPEGPIEDMFNDKARGNPDGGALQIFVLDREPGGSTLTAFTPDDQLPECGNQLPQVTDPEGDATGFIAVESTPLPSEPSLDVTRGFMTWDPVAESLTFHIEVKDLASTPPLGAAGHFFRYFFNYSGARYQVTAASDVSGQSWDLRTGDNTGLAEGLSGSFDAAADEITIVLTADQLAAAVASAPRFAAGAVIDGFETLGQRSEVAVTLTADTARGSCTYRIGQERLAPNGRPVAGDDSSSTVEDTSVDIVVLANDSDPDGDPLTVVSAGIAQAGGTASINADGTVRFRPAANFTGTDAFAYTIGDGQGGTATGRVTVTVAPAPDPPEAADDSIATPAGQSVTIAVLANDTDPDGDPLSVVSVTDGSGGRATHNGATVTYTPGGGFVISDAVTYTVRDPQGHTDTATVTIFRSDCAASFFDDLEPAPEPGWSFQSSNGLPFSRTWAHIVDPLASSVTHSFFSDATDASANKDDRLIAPAQLIGPATRLRFFHRFRTEANFDGGVIEVSTDGGTTWTDVLAAGGVFEKGGYNGTANALNGRLAWQGASAPTMSEVVVRLGALAGRTAKIRFRLVTDANLGDAGWWIDDIRFTDIVAPSCPSPNHSPVAGNDAASTSRATAVIINVLANDSDPDGDRLTVSHVVDPSGGSVSTNGSSVTYTPDAGFSGTDVFGYTVSDGFGGSATGTVTVSINDPPDAVDDSATTLEDQAATIAVLDNDADVDADPLRVASVTAPGHGAASVNSDGTISYVPAEDFSGTDAFSYVVSDGRGGSDSAGVSVTVTAVNDAPVAGADMASSNGDAIDVAVLANDTDPDGDALVVLSVGRPSHGTAKIRSDGTVRYRPRGSFSGTDTFTYTIGDGNGGVSTATVTLSVQP